MFSAVRDVTRRSSYEGLKSAWPVSLLPEVLSGICRGHSRESIYSEQKAESERYGRQEKAPLDRDEDLTSLGFRS
jgi:hypothetical protein